MQNTRSENIYDTDSFILYITPYFHERNKSRIMENRE